MKRFLFFILAVLFIVGAYMAWGPASPLQREPVWIAVAGPMENLRGQAMKKGVELCRDIINEHGGIHGRRLELIYYNDENDPEKAQKHAEDIAAENRAAVVIGHYGNDTSATAGKVYKRYEIPAITASASDQFIIADNEWYFRVIPGTGMEGTFAAAYIANVFSGRRVSVIFSNDAYGQTLARQFTKTAQRMCLEVAHQWEWNIQKDAPEPDIEKAIQEIVSVEDPGVVFLATHAWEGAKIVTALKDMGKTWTIIGSYAFARSFPIELESYPRHQSQPGYYSSGILFLTPYMAEFAGAKADAFNRNFKEKYQQTPSEISACYYDAILMAVAAIEKSGIRGPAHIREDRLQIRAALESFHSAKTAIRGVAGDIFFDESGGVKRHFAVGVWQDDTVLPAFIQYQYIADAKYPNLTRAILTGDAILADGVVMKKIRMIFAAIDAIQINRVDVTRMTHEAEFDLHLFYSGKFDNATADAIEFTNAAGPIEQIGPVAERREYNAIFRQRRLKGLFRFNPDILQYPFDTQRLFIRFRHKTRTSDDIMFVPYNLSHSAALTALPAEWSNSGIFFYQNISEKLTSLGNPEFFDEPRRISYSQFNAEINLERKAPNLAFSYFLVIISMICILLYAFFFVSAHSFRLRLILSVGVCLTSTAAMLISSTRILKNADMTLPDLCFIAILILAGITIKVKGKR